MFLVSYLTFASPSIRELDESEDWVYFYLATSLDEGYFVYAFCDLTFVLAWLGPRLEFGNPG